MKRKVKHRIMRWSLLAGLGSIFLTTGVLLFFRGVLPYNDLGETNLATLNRIGCHKTQPSGLVQEDRLCDVSEITSDRGEEASDYVLTRGTHYFLLTSTSYPGFWLNSVDLAFVRSFRQPMTVEMPTDETWRLYSQPAQIGTRKLEVLVGVMERGPSTFVEVPITPDIDQRLAAEANRIASRVSLRDGQVHVAGINTKLDLWEILDGETGRVFRWIEDALGRLPPSEQVTRGMSLHRERGDLYLVRTDVSTDLVAVTLSFIINLWALVASLGVVFVAVCGSFYTICATWFRRYFLLIGGRRVSLAEALKGGESKFVEFKQASDHQESLLKAITAFANSNDGTVFVGIADNGQVEGIEAETLEERDKFQQRILNGVREKIRPAPAIDIDFELCEGVVIAKIFVPQGDRLYSLGGRFYVRKGVESVAAEFEDIKRVLDEQFAW